MLAMFEKKLQFSLSDYTALAVLGEGSFGQVFLVSHKKTNKKKALKILNKKALAQNVQLDHLMNEVNCMALADNSPCIIGLRGLSQTKQFAMLLMDYVQGMNLYQLEDAARQHGLGPQVTTCIAAQVMLALNGLHKKKVMHRDIKPQNVMVDRLGKSFLIDFGLSVNLKTDKCYTVCGTPQFMAPQLLDGSGYSFQGDWWSFGVLLYQMIQGRELFNGQDPLKIYQQIKKCCLFNTVPFAFRKSRLVDQSLMKRLVQPKRQKRLGFGKQGAKQIKSHPFFKNQALQCAESAQMYIPAQVSKQVKTFMSDRPLLNPKREGVCYQFQVDVHRSLKEKLFTFK